MAPLATERGVGLMPQMDALCDPEMASAFLLPRCSVTGREYFPSQIQRICHTFHCSVLFLARLYWWEQQVTIKHSGAINIMRNTGQNCLCCHFHHIRLWAWHLVHLPPVLILSVKDEAEGTSSSSCLVILAGNQSSHQQYHALLSLLNIWWGIYRLRLGENW